MQVGRDNFHRICLELFIKQTQESLLEACALCYDYAFVFVKGSCEYCSAFFSKCKEIPALCNTPSIGLSLGIYLNRSI